jgi:hypothetical protein
MTCPHRNDSDCSRCVALESSHRLLREWARLLDVLDGEGKRPRIPASLDKWIEQCTKNPRMETQQDEDL